MAEKNLHERLVQLLSSSEADFWKLVELATNLDGEPLCRRQLRYARSVFGDGSLKHAEGHARLADFLTGSGRLREAEGEYRASLRALDVAALSEGDLAIADKLGVLKQLHSVLEKLGADEAALEVAGEILGAQREMADWKPSSSDDDTNLGTGTGSLY